MKVVQRNIFCDQAHLPEVNFQINHLQFCKQKLRAVLRYLDLNLRRWITVLDILFLTKISNYVAILVNTDICNPQFTTMSNTYGGMYVHVEPNDNN